MSHLLELLHDARSDLQPWARSLQQSDLPIAPDPNWVGNCYSACGPERLNAWLDKLTEPMSAHIGKNLKPLNTFLRYYRHGAFLREHIDRIDIDWTAGLTLLHDGPAWPLLTAKEKFLGPVYVVESGSIKHWRETFAGKYSVVALFHWQIQDANKHPAAAVVPRVFSKSDIDFIQHSVSNMQSSTPTVSINGETDIKIRSGQLRWLSDTKYEWITKKLEEAVAAANDKYWKMDISGTKDAVQHMCYGESNHYDWHIDVDLNASGTMQRRSVSIVCLLQHADEGGGIEIDGIGVIDLKPGDAVVFPSKKMHRALKVIRGERESLTHWMTRKE